MQQKPRSSTRHLFCKLDRVAGWLGYGIYRAFFTSLDRCACVRLETIDAIVPRQSASMDFTCRSCLDHPASRTPPSGCQEGRTKLMDKDLLIQAIYEPPPSAIMQESKLPLDGKGKQDSVYGRCIA
ncbi:hypothetical protein KP509_38G018600 [Ceratopteris richardii]|uniref:Uncharacterized protein n=1 Tax=Ceratopteris richardii TaxID=49495 RepID=A0A8T2Q219_CERRI|nr:hypothetical protein KP509_38G018600 [Ceratopteris richardii]